MKYILNIQPLSSEIETLYQNHETFNEGDSGLDLFIPNDIFIKSGETVFVKLGIKCEMIEYAESTQATSRYASYYLYPRSSISKTPLLLHNSVGIIDSGYRGELVAAFKYVPTTQDIININKLSDVGEIPTYKISKGTRLVQICSPNLSPFKFVLSSSLSETQRGEAGFGSTGI
jgi:dUTP pyrophosphatase